MASHDTQSRDPKALLPLTPAVFHVLLSLVDGQKHGYLILKEVGRPYRRRGRAQHRHALRHRQAAARRGPDPGIGARQYRLPPRLQADRVRPPRRARRGRAPARLAEERAGENAPGRTFRSLTDESGATPRTALSRAAPPLSRRVQRRLRRSETADFRDQHDEMARRGRPWHLWARTIAGVVRRAPREHADVLWRDVAYAVRQLTRRRGATLGAIAALAVGLGVNTAVFGLAASVLWRPLPFAGSERLVALQEISADPAEKQTAVSSANFVDWEARSRTLAGLALVSGRRAPSPPTATRSISRAPGSRRDSSRSPRFAPSADGCSPRRTMRR